MTRTTYRVTKRFTSGSLAGLVLTEDVRSIDAPFAAGDVITPCAWTGPGYVVENVEVVAPAS